MPRISSESRAAAAYRAGVRPPRPPRSLNDDAKALWRAIVDEWPADKFNSAAQQILGDFCTFAAKTNVLRGQYEGLTEPEQAALIDEELQKLARLKATLAAKLRLTPQSATRADAGENTEDQPSPARNRLLVGSAGWTPAVVKAG